MQTDTQSNCQTDRQTGKHTDGQADIQAGRQADKACKVSFGLMVVVAFVSSARILGTCSSFIPCLSFFCCCCFKVEISSCTLIPLFRPGSVHGGSVS